MLISLTRRAFVATCSGAIAALALDGRGLAHPAPTGPVYGRTGRGGIGPGTPSNPSRGEVILLDGRVIEATHVNRGSIPAGGSVWLAPEADGSWSILYAEFLA